MHVTSLLNGSFHLQVFVEALKKGIFFKESSDFEQARLFNLGEVFLWAEIHICSLQGCLGLRSKSLGSSTGLL